LGMSLPAAATIIVVPRAFADPVSITVAQGATSGSVTLTGVGHNQPAPGAGLRYAVTGQLPVAQGSVAIVGNQVTYTPAVNTPVGDYIFKFTASDDLSTSAEQTGTISVVTRAVANAASITVAQGATSGSVT